MKNYARIDGGVIVELFATDGDMSEMFHPDLVWVEIPDGVSPASGWSYADGIFLAPAPPTTEQIGAAALLDKKTLMEWAGVQISPLQDAVDLEEATEIEIGQLRAWKQYRVALNRIEQQDGWPERVKWPDQPSPA